MMKKLKEFDEALNKVLLNLAKKNSCRWRRSFKIYNYKINNCKTEHDAKKIGFSIANSPLVKNCYCRRRS